MRNYTITKEDRDHADTYTEEDLMDLLFDRAFAEASDGCTVEDDGVCPHGRPSPVLVLGLI